jgi:hypothetical protein
MKDGQPTAQSGLPDSVFEFPKQRKEPLTDHNMCATRSRDSIRSSTSPMPTVLWRSRTSREPPTTMASTSRKRHGTTWAFTLKDQKLQRVDVERRAKETNWSESRAIEEIMAEVK